MTYLCKTIMMMITFNNWQVFEAKLGWVSFLSKGITTSLQSQPGLHSTHSS